jgi:hypothetical protein
MWHYGIDIKVQKGDSIRAAFDGMVRVTTFQRRGFGNVVVVRHANGLETIYGHLSKNLVAANQMADAVRPFTSGAAHALTGRIRARTGAHLAGQTLAQAGVPFESVADLSSLAAYRLPALRSVGEAGPLTPLLILAENALVADETLFVGDMDGWIYKTINRGASWTEGALTGSGLEIDSIVASPTYNGYPTDIPEDFYVNASAEVGTIVRIPLGAAYLMFSGSGFVAGRC